MTIKNLVKPEKDNWVGDLEIDLPAVHWLCERDDNAFGVQAPPMLLRCGTDHKSARLQLTAAAMEAARYAIRVSTQNGMARYFDPDDMVRNFIIGLVGYVTPNGLGGEPGDDPDAAPNQVVGITWEK